MHLSEKTIKQQTSHLNLEGGWEEYCARLSLQELTPQYRPKGTKTVLMETFLQHVSIKVQYQAFSSACVRY